MYVQKVNRHCDHYDVKTDHNDNANKSILLLSPRLLLIMNTDWSVGVNN